ncbi:hypothetical protein N7U49_16445 [Streptomyces sp. AD2-2]|nr:hypothetical protein N7U49_16445 [Streptomyces sp. AD2-2]
MTNAELTRPLRLVVHRRAGPGRLRQHHALGLERADVFEATSTSVVTAGAGTSRPGPSSRADLRDHETRLGLAVLAGKGHIPALRALPPTGG